VITKECEKPMLAKDFMIKKRMDALESGGNFKNNFNVCRMLDGLSFTIDAPLTRKANPNFDI
jgi:hypothetical protein